jgi:hypothetical protein
MNLFEKKFLNILQEAPGDVVDPAAAVDVPPEAEAAAVADTMEPATDPTALAVPDNPEVALKKQQSERTISTIETWIGEVEGFIDYLNGTDEGSINFALNSADCDSLITDIQRSESKKISRLAQDLSSLGESLKQYLLLARHKEQNSSSI